MGNRQGYSNLLPIDDCLLPTYGIEQKFKM